MGNADRRPIHGGHPERADADELQHLDHGCGPGLDLHLGCPLVTDRQPATVTASGPAAEPSQTGTPQPVLLEVRGVSKGFPGVVALERASINVRAGEVHGLVGENGAGKSTLLKVITGIYSADEGEILWDGEATGIKGPT